MPVAKVEEIFAAIRPFASSTICAEKIKDRHSFASTYSIATAIPDRHTVRKERKGSGGVKCFLAGEIRISCALDSDKDREVMSEGFGLPTEGQLPESQAQLACVVSRNLQATASFERSSLATSLYST